MAYAISQGGIQKLLSEGGLGGTIFFSTELNLFYRGGPIVYSKGSLKFSKGVQVFQKRWGVLILFLMETYRICSFLGGPRPPDPHSGSAISNKISCTDL